MSQVSAQHEIVGQPLISVGVACFNGEATIERALRSAMGQDWPNLEIVVVNDGSTDGTLAVIEKLAAEDSRIRLVNQERNQGYAASCNRILAEARGAFVAFFDADDVSLPNRLSRQFERLTTYEKETNESLVLCHTSFTSIRRDGQRRYRSALGADQTPAPMGAAVAEHILIGRPVAGGGGEAANCSLMARNSVFEHMCGFDKALRREEDTDFTLRLALAGGHFAGLSAPLVEKYSSGDPTKRTSSRRAEDVFVEKHRALLEALSWYGFTIEWLHFKRDILDLKWRGMVTKGIFLLVRYPVKTARRVVWALPNLHRYRGRFRRRPH